MPGNRARIWPVAKPNFSKVALPTPAENVVQTMPSQPILTSAGVFLLFAGLMNAQTPNTRPLPAPAAVANTGAEAPRQLEAYEVTGSRIRLSAGEAPAIPVFELSRIQLEEIGVNRLADIRQAIPQLAPAIGFNDNLLNGGPSRGQMASTSFNLRGLGGNATLVLVDGKRVPHSGQEAPGGAGGREDFNVDGIPVNAIERVEILPQGASAIYGSEAMAGVVNIVLKRNYNGAQLSVNYDNTFDSDVGDLSVTLTAGFRRKKLSTFLTVNWEKQNGMRGIDRWFNAKDSSFYGASASYLNSQVAGGPGALSSTSSPLNANQANLPGLTTNIVAIPAGSRGTGLTPAVHAAAGAPSAPFDPAPFQPIIDEAHRRSLVFKADYDLAAGVQAYLQARYSKFLNDYTAGPTTLSLSLPVGALGNPFPSAVFLRKVFWDLPRYQMESYQENSGLVLGLRGRVLAERTGFLRDWRYDLGANYSRNVIDDLIKVNTFNTAKLTAALNDPNPANRPVLAYDSTVAGTNPNAAGLLESFLVPPAPHHHDTTDVDQYTFQADGTLASGWAGDVKAAFGGEASQEKVRFYRDPGDSALGYTLTKPFSRRVKAAFAEITVPLLSARQQLPLVHRLETGAAVRTEEFSDVGSHRTPRYHALFQPVRGLTFRASRAEGFKVARLYDLRAPIFTSTSTLTAASNVRDTLRGGELVLGTVTSVSGGNPTLQPETSVSRNGGVVVDVPGRWFQGLSLSADTWELHYSNKVGGPSRQVLIDFFPERVTRTPRAASDPAGYAGVITGFDTSNINLARYDARGVDYSASYQRATPVGRLTVSGTFSDPKVIASKSTPAATTFGYTWLPARFAGSVFLRQGAWTMGTTMSYQARYYTFASATSAPYPSVILWNPQVAYDFSRGSRFSPKAADWYHRWLAGTKVSVTIPNVFNTGPSELAKYAGRAGVYDSRLRRYILNITRSF